MFVDDVDVPRDVAALIDAARKRNEPPPRPHQLRRWGGALTVRCNEEARVLELARARTLPIEVPGLDVVWCVAGDSTRFALGLRNGELCFVREQGSAWERVTLRRDVHLMDPRDISLEASGEIALLRWTRSSDLMHWWSGRWRALPPGYPVLVERDQIWVCRYSEWGSELVCWSPSGELLDAGNFTLVRPVRLVRASAEALVVAGAAPQNASCSWLCDAARHNVDPHRDSCLYVGRWAAGRKQPLLAIGYVAGIEALADLGRAIPASESAIDTFLARSAQALAYVRETQPDWHSRDQLESIDIDTDNRIYVLTTHRGLFRLDGDRLVALTPAWPADLCCPGAEMRIIDRTAAIVRAAGDVLLCTLDGEPQLRRVQLR